MAPKQERPTAQIIPLVCHEDNRGKLVALENGRNVPFDMQRLFFVVGATGDRGFHAHRLLNELIIAAQGSCRVITDNGSARTEHWLYQPGQALHLPPLHWIELGEFSPDCVLVVLADAPYEDAEYIRDHGTFLSAVREAQAR